MSTSKEIIWLVAHYPDVPEMDERIQKALDLHRATNLPIWVFASSTTQFPKRVELLIQEKLFEQKMDPGKIVLSSNFGEFDTLDTVQEIENIISIASREGVEKVYAVSNPLQLLQVKGLSRKGPLQFEFVPSRLKDWRWWYVSVRLLLIPLAFLGVGKRFPPLLLVRHARSRWTRWSI